MGKHKFLVCDVCGIQNDTVEIRKDGQKRCFGCEQLSKTEREDKKPSDKTGTGGSVITKSDVTGGGGKGKNKKTNR